MRSNHQDTGDLLGHTAGVNMWPTWTYIRCTHVTYLDIQQVYTCDLLGHTAGVLMWPTWTHRRCTHVPYLDIQQVYTCDLLGHTAGVHKWPTWTYSRCTQVTYLDTQQVYTSDCLYSTQRRSVPTRLCYTDGCVSADPAHRSLSRRSKTTKETKHLRNHRHCFISSSSNQ